MDKPLEMLNLLQDYLEREEILPDKNLELEIHPGKAVIKKL